MTQDKVVYVFRYRKGNRYPLKAVWGYDLQHAIRRSRLSDIVEVFTCADVDSEWWTRNTQKVS